MDNAGASSGRRKVRFTPKAPPPSRKPKPTVAKAEADQAQYLLGRFNENQRRQRPKPEKKSPVQVAIGPGAATSSSISIMTYGAQRDMIAKNDSELSSDTSDDMQIISSLPSATKEDELDGCVLDATNASTPKSKKEYVEPWDYHHSYYPVTLPLRRPYSGDPELLDEAEFGEAARNLEYDESTLNAASDLGLLEDCKKEDIFLFQFPPNLPLVKLPASSKGKEKAESSVPSERSGALKKGFQLDDLPGGHMGKLLVYKSGAVKLKLGETLFDVSLGLDCICPQDVAAINTAEKHCCVIGEIGKRVVVSAGVNAAFDSVINLD